MCRLFRSLGVPHASEVAVSRRQELSDAHCATRFIPHFFFDHSHEYEALCVKAGIDSARLLATNASCHLPQGELFS
ncbi:hypothetical protein J6590_015010 [Homalodisca vitripennis]|nr:hypothetical protein J6590_015010 [Homalodisca vitripennis]